MKKTEKRKNPYGYTTDLTDPDISKMYDIYHKKHGIPTWCPLSDAERKAFDRAVEEFYKRRNGNG